MRASAFELRDSSDDRFDLGKFDLLVHGMGSLERVKQKHSTRFAGVWTQGDVRVWVRIESATTTGSTNAFRSWFDSRERPVRCRLVSKTRFRFNAWFLIVAGRDARILAGLLGWLASFEFLDSSLEVFTTGGEVLYSLPKGFADGDKFLFGEAFKVWYRGWHVLVRVADQAGLGDWDEQLQFKTGNGKNSFSKNLNKVIIPFSPFS